MTSLVHHSPAPAYGGGEHVLSGFIQEDIKFAQRKPRVPILGALMRTRLQWFYVLDFDSEVPYELNERKYRDIRPSEVRAPANQETLDEIKRALQARTNECRLEVLKIRDCASGSFIIYSIKTRINRRKHQL